VPICRDWATYKDEKCMKIMSDGLSNFDDAKKACEAEPGATLVSIHTAEEQEFITNTFFKEKKIADSIWIALRKANNEFKWSDTTKFDFQNWDKESPSNTSLEDCVQMNPESSRLGKWSDELCSRRNLALCQKVPELSLIRLNKLLSTIKEIETFALKKLVDVKMEMRYKYSIDIFKDEWIYLQTFNNTDGTHKGLIFPLDDNKETSTRDQAAKKCEKYNSTLVEIKSWDKQFIVNSFIGHIKTSPVGININAFHLNGGQVSKGTFKWLLGNTELSYKNWFPTRPVSDDGYDLMGLTLDMNENFGKWFNFPKTTKQYVICEISITD
jgi:hypothetical protein